MVGPQTCQHIKENGEPCRATPLSDVGFCLWHSPDHTSEAGEARRLGGLRRRRERTVAGAYDLEGLHTVEQVRRLLEIATVDCLGLENSIARARALAAIAMALLKTFEVAELAERLAA